MKVFPDLQIDGSQIKVAKAASTRFAIPIPLKPAAQGERVVERRAVEVCLACCTGSHKGLPT